MGLLAPLYFAGLLAIALPVGLLLAAATIYCRYHYVVDVFAGFALAFVTLPLAYRLYDRWARRRGTDVEPQRGDSTIA